MPIEATLLERIKTNDPSLKTLELCFKKLNANDIPQLVNALATNTTLTALDIRHNDIGVEGAKALAANTRLTTLDISWNQIGAEGAKALADNTTLTTLNVEFNQIGAEGAKALAANTTLTTLHLKANRIGAEGAKVLAANTTLTTLDVRKNKIGIEGAKALAANTTLTTLDVGYSDKISDEWWKRLEQAIARNNQQILLRRNQFIQALLVLACDKGNPQSQSLWSSLPKELMLFILNLMTFHPDELIGKNANQIYRCAHFIFENSATVHTVLSQGHGIKIMEKVVNGKSQFRFFQPTAQRILSQGELDPTAIFKPN